MSVKKTGNNVQISREELINATIKNLIDYDNLSIQEQKNQTNPYINPVYVKTSNGKIVEVPQTIQKFAIDKLNQYNHEHRTFKKQTNFDGENTVRYVNHDPFIMDQELANEPIGNVNDKSYVNSYDDEHIYDVHEEQNIVNVGKTVLFNPSHQGGSYGDLPRDFGLFQEKTNQNIDTNVYYDYKKHTIYPSKYYDDNNNYDTKNPLLQSKHQYMNSDTIIGVEYDDDDVQELPHESTKILTEMPSEQSECSTCINEYVNHCDNITEQSECSTCINEYVNHENQIINDELNDNIEEIENFYESYDYIYKYLFYVMLCIVLFILFKKTKQ